MTQLIDSFLDRFTMYRLTLYYLIALVGLGFVLSLFGLVPARPEAILSTTAILLAASLGANAVFSRIWRIRSNPESSLITALILALILDPVWPVANPRGALVIALAAAVGMASKYLLAFRRQHLFNPAAVAALFSGLVFGAFASWWVGGTWLLPLVVVGGALLARKVSRFRLIGVFLGEFILFLVVLSLLNGLGPDMIVQSMLFVLGQSAVVFFAVVMLTEPMTSPKRFSLQALYAGIVAFLYQPQLAILGHNLTPEQALMIGNLFSYLVSPSYKLRLEMKEQRRIGSEIVSFTFARPAWFRHKPGQYMEWSLPLHNADSRGTRRYFSLASSPTEDEIMIAARFPVPASRFKEALLETSPGSLVTAGELAGDFTLPRDPRKPLAFIAGGIGITPFRSMLKYLADRGEKRDIVLLYSAGSEEQIVFADVLEEARKTVGVNVTVTLTDLEQIRAGWTGARGQVDGAMIRQVIPDASRRLFLVSGPPGMVNSAKTALKSAGVPRSSIRTDYFPGYPAKELAARSGAREGRRLTAGQVSGTSG
jgi:ferredoxin-NADP reductase/Na+-translocating ferredoxin:NAD+ oxidoreductase RnfD subunit